MLKKLKSLLNKTEKPDDQTNQEDSAPFDHPSPVSHRIKEWIESKGWTYEYCPPDKDDELCTHYFIIGFRDGDFYWNCLINVHEKNQLVSFQGLIILDDIQPQYYLPIIMMFNAVNFDLDIGSIEFNVLSAATTARAKVGLDAEFCTLSDGALNCYFHNLTWLTKQAHETVKMALSDPNPSQDLLAASNEQGLSDKDNNEPLGFYLVNDKNQPS